MSDSEFPVPPDLRPLLDEIAERLVTKHAAVMIGSGFSRNAQPVGTKSLKLPEWSHLGDLFHRKLYGEAPCPNFRYLSVSTLALEVESAFGRPALERIIRDAIPDLEFEPSELHTKLLDLPWTDVFTTNYDTLLERASRTTSVQRYDHVSSPRDLASAERPRIVKLHGSLQSSTQLTVTDEDYRTYPLKLAPFLYTVRQSLVENTLCLIGFSCTDTNFLQWIGWVQDNLDRQDSPTMYLVGALSLSNSQIEVLRRRNIVALDMSHCHDIEAGDHFNALNRFTSYLSRKLKEYDFQNWPKVQTTVTSQDAATTEQEITALVRTWKKDRVSYPGWVVVPEEGRTRLRSDTLDQYVKWWKRESDALSELPKYVDLEFACELLWRAEKSLLPIFDDQIEFYETVIERYLPCLESPPDVPGEFPPVHQEYRDKDKPLTEVKANCHQLLLATLRYYREEGLWDNWSMTSQRLESCQSTMSAEFIARYSYECALAALFELDIPKLKRRIVEWPTDNTLPLWEAKRAGLLAEIGQVEDAKRILRNSLEVIRNKSNLKPVLSDYSVVSQESVVMLLLQFLPVSDWEDISRIREEFHDRWNALQQFKCDPKKEIRILDLILERLPARRIGQTERPTFEIGGFAKSLHLGSADSGLIAAYNRLRLLEDIGLPIRMTDSKGTRGVLSHFAGHSSYWGMVSLIRLGSTNQVKVDCMFDRISLDRMSRNHIDSLVHRFLDALELASPDIEKGDASGYENVGIRLATILPEVLSRLCCKCSNASRDRILTFLSQVYLSNAREHYRGIRNLVNRLLEAFSVRQRIEMIPRLLDFPFLTKLNPKEEREFVNPIYFLRLRRDEMTDAPELPDEKLSKLMEKAVSACSNEREWAVCTLARLHNWSLLNSVQEGKFAEILWSRCDESCWPIDTGLERCFILTLPHPARINPKELFSGYLQDTSFPEVANAGQATFPGRWTVLNDVEWATQHSSLMEKDLTFILRQCLRWWDEHQDKVEDYYITEPLLGMDSDFKRDTLSLIGVVKALVESSVNLKVESDMKEGLRKLASQLAEKKLPATSLASACLQFLPENRESLLLDIKEKLASEDNDTVVEALSAVQVFLNVARSPGKCREFRTDAVQLLQIVGEMIFWRRSTGLPHALTTVSIALTKHPWSFSAVLEKMVLSGLQWLVVETATEKSNYSNLQQEVDEWNFARNLHVRRQAACLSHTLAKHYSEKGESPPLTIRKWESICRSEEEFAEIRNEWQGTVPG